MAAQQTMEPRKYKLKMEVGQSRKRSKKERKSFIQDDRAFHNPPRISLGDQLNRACRPQQGSPTASCAFGAGCGEHCRMRNGRGGEGVSGLGMRWGGWFGSRGRCWDRRRGGGGCLSDDTGEESGGSGGLGEGVLDHGAIKEGPADAQRLPITQEWGDGR